MKIAIDTLGCKLNQAETELLSRQWTAAGHRLVSSVEEADIYILNTCTVTQMADAKSRRLLRLAHRRNAGALLVAAGCYAQRAPGELAGIEGVSLVSDNGDKAGILLRLDESGLLSTETAANEDRYVEENEPVSRTRALIKIQDGCDAFCSYCIVPLVRGKGKSLPAARVIAEVRERVADGIREVVLTGTEIGSYDDGGEGLKELLEKILAETSLARLRLSSLQPGEISPEFISLWKDDRLCPHFHLSLQSGSDSVLRRMNRQYSLTEYCEALSLIRAQVPDAAVTTDMITGFPGETEAEFEESYRSCRRLGFARIHVFPYSPRKGTAAAGMAVRVTGSVRTQRNQKLRALAGECAKFFIRQFSGRIMDVLWEKQTGGIWSGHTPNYIKVYSRSDDELANRIRPVKLLETRGDGVWGEPVP